MSFRETIKDLDRRQQIVWLAFIWLALGSLLWLWWDERTLPDIRGAWAGPPCEEIRSAQGVSYVRREMRIEEGAWSLAIRFHADAECARPTHALDVSGAYDLGPKTIDVRGATTARFDVEKILLTPLSDEAVALASQARCGTEGWQLGDSQDVSSLGCLGLAPSRDDCPTEYDIVKLERGMLYLGDRSQGMCDEGRYPARFASTPLERRAAR